MYFDKNLCHFQLEVDTKQELFETMTNTLLTNGCVKDNYLDGITEREEEYPTALLINGTGFAIPHTDSVRVNESQICFASLKNPIEFRSMTNKEEIVIVDLVFMLAMSQPHEQMETLQNLVALFQDDEAVAKLKVCASQEEFNEILEKANVA